MSGTLMLILAFLSPVLIIAGAILLATTKNHILGGILIALGFILGAVMIGLNQKWNDDLVKLAQDKEYFVYVPSNNPLTAVAEPVSKEAAEKAVADVGGWFNQFDLINALDGKEPTKGTDELLDKLAFHSDGMTVRYVKWSTA